MLLCIVTSSYGAPIVCESRNRRLARCAGVSWIDAVLIIELHESLYRPERLNFVQKTAWQSVFGMARSVNIYL